MKVKQSNVTEGSEFDIHHHIKDPGALKAEKKSATEDTEQHYFRDFNSRNPQFYVILTMEKYPSL